jgi:AcrR family transcriptional regulator
MSTDQSQRPARRSAKPSRPRKGTPRPPAGRGRREPVQERSRRTVARILRATEEIIATDGVDAATTRTIAERAKVAAPSLYRFFDDRDAILDALLEAMLAQLETVVEDAEQEVPVESIESIEAFVRLELEIHAAYFERHPSLARLWFGGRVSPAVVELVRARNRQLAGRARRVLTETGLVDPATPALVFDLLIEYGDRTLDIASRGEAHGEREVIEAGITALTAFVERFPPPGARSGSGRGHRSRRRRE